MSGFGELRESLRFFRTWSAKTSGQTLPFAAERGEGSVRFHPGEALKSRQGDEAWIYFFSIVSAAFSHIEKRPVSARFSDLAIGDIHRTIARAEAELNALDLMRGFSVATENIPQVTGMRGYYYHLIVLDSEQRTVRVRPFRRDDFEEAVLEWERIEKRVAEGKRLEPVLVAAGTLHDTRQAYPNFFLDMRRFGRKIRQIISGV